MGLFTVGHSTRTLDEFLDLLEAHGIRRVVDVRRFPGSRRHPHFGSDAVARALEARAIAYEHAEALGGRRSTSPTSSNTGWRNASFRGYADHMQTHAFQVALERLLAQAAREPVAIMCAEAVPWRCHRNLIADAAAARGVTSRHITAPDRAEEHRLSGHAVVAPDGSVRYPAAAAQADLF